MSVTILQGRLRPLPSAREMRFGRSLASSELSAAEWILKRNCSLSPRQLLASYLVLLLVSFAIGLGFWLQGATLILPFCGLELLALGVAMLFYARHAADSETIRLCNGRLTVEHISANKVERVELGAGCARVGVGRGERSLVEIAGPGGRISVGRFVRPELRRQLAEELRWALRRWQQAPAEHVSSISEPERARFEMT